MRCARRGSERIEMLIGAELCSWKLKDLRENVIIGGGGGRGGGEGGIGAKRPPRGQGLIDSEEHLPIIHFPQPHYFFFSSPPSPPPSS